MWPFKKKLSYSQLREMAMRRMIEKDIMAHVKASKLEWRYGYFWQAEIKGSPYTLYHCNVFNSTWVRSSIGEDYPTLSESARLELHSIARKQIEARNEAVRKQELKDLYNARKS